MKIQDQVCTLEQANKLRELGVEQKGYFVYRHWRGNGNIILSKLASKYNDYPKNRRQVSPNVLASAFTVAELGVMLGEGCPSWQFKNTNDKSEIWIATRIGPNNTEDREVQINTYASFDRFGSTQAEALATLLISCIECNVPGFLTEEVNNRLAL